ncbi:MAG: (4Fe-4S)-binding protein [Deltaproteobacteria bacterium RIFOXYD12_FULL_50_9]|nr:MAG: (4Fe-4S)-binding protein [Deltaproteobacteria bacterium RIFOXYD12_FULL_50_9]
MEALRKWIQTIFGLLVNGYWAFPFTRAIYQGPLKVICAPGLNCYSCPAATTSCAIGSLQHLLAGLRLSLESGQYYFGLYVVGCLGVLGGLFGRMICGWLCPFGFCQELIHKTPSKKFHIPAILNYLKYGILLIMVILLPLLAVDKFGAGSPWFCKYLCPAGTLEAGIPMLILQPNLRDIIGTLFYSKLSILIGFTLWSVFASRPFCRTACPLGAFYALFAKIQVVRLKFHPEKCTACGACHSVCPMGVKFNESPEDKECITCLACMDRACKVGAISLEVGGLPLCLERGHARTKHEQAP